MLSTVNLGTQEEIDRSRELAAELAGAGITAERRTDLLVEMERATGKVLRKLNEEILQDLNNLSPLLRGNFIKKLTENYEIEIENREKIERWKWTVEVVNGRKVQFDPLAENPKYEPIPLMTVQRSRTIYLCSTNRGQVAAIEKLLKDFWARVKSQEFKYTPIDKIISEKLAVENAIGKIDRSLMAEERLSEVEYLDSEFIKKPARPMVRPADGENDLFKRFDTFKAGAAG